MGQSSSFALPFFFEDYIYEDHSLPGRLGKYWLRPRNKPDGSALKLVGGIYQSPHAHN